MNWRIQTNRKVDYEVVMTDGVFNTHNKCLFDRAGASRRLLVVIDSKVNSLYRSDIDSYFKDNGLFPHYVLMDGVEAKKNTDSLFMLLGEMEQFGISRRSEPVIAIGGGVVQDVVGLACTVYRRGVPYIRIPTTLLGIVDVSIAAKTAVNFMGRRNRLGSYYPPICSILDKRFIKTQDAIEISSGMGEMLKMAVIKDRGLFEVLEQNGASMLESRFSHFIATEAIKWSVHGMKQELENNLWEENLSRCVDFGHSFSPIIEMRSLSTDNPLTHGQAVTIDVILSCIISNMRGLLSNEDLNRVIKTAKSMGLLVTHPMFKDVALLLEALNDTTKHRGGHQHLPIPTMIGSYTFIEDLTFEEICEASKRL